MPAQEETEVQDIVSGVVYFARCEHKEAARDTVLKVQELTSEGGKALVVLGLRSLHESAITVKEYCLQLLRQHGLHKNERELVLSEEDQLVALQLTLAERNKQLLGDYDVEMSTVLEFNKKITSEKLGVGLQSVGDADPEYQEVLAQYRSFLESSNVTDFMEVYCRLQAECRANEQLRKQVANKDFLVLNAAYGLLEMTMLKLLAQDKSVYRVQNEISLDESLPLGDPHFEPSTLEKELGTGTTENNSPKTPGLFTPCSSTPRPTACVGTPASNQGSVSEIYARRILLSYIQILVNIRSELALARSINVPDRDIDHQAFTDIKKAAKTKNMPMFQMASSYVMRLRLGGRSYAPDPNSPLAMHVKGIGEFTDLVHKLQTVIEEDDNTSSAVKRVINIIKNIIVKSRDNCIRRQSVDTVAEELRTQAQQVLLELEQTATSSPSRTASAGGSLIGRNTQKLLRGLLDHAAAQPSPARASDVLTDAFSSQHTPLRFPSLLSQFRSPLEHSPESKHEKSLAQRMQEKLSQKPKNRTAVPRFGACMNWAQPLHSSGFEQKLDDLDPNTVDEHTVIPSKTLVQPAAPAVKKPSSKKVAESATDQENVSSIVECTEAVSSGGATKPRDVGTKCKASNKRTADSMLLSSQPCNKKAKKVTKPKKKVLPLPKGQKQLTAFFRL